ncbi:hypothetical protein GCM10022239_03840 [Leifsonia bigeumensis]|uniref:Uncharacterized protein n=1 Tax=Leifsonella bigeumensis TaxID=433643 RepID=A0ABP7F538_9MICO
MIDDERRAMRKVNLILTGIWLVFAAAVAVVILYLIGEGAL